VSSRTRLIFGLLVVDETAVDDVGEASFQCAQRFAVALAGLSFALVVGAALGAVADLGDRHDVQGVVSWRSPARESRWRTTSPEDTSIATPA
jgi:hypothetical protein